MNRMLNFAYSHRRLLAVLLFGVFTGVLLDGMVRAFDYDVPMLRQDYEQAATPKSIYEGPKGDLPPMPGTEETWDDLMWHWVMQRYNEYVDTSVGSRALAAYNHALSLYEAGNLDGAKSAFEKAFAACCDSNGKVLPKYHRLCSDIQLLIGNVYATNQKTEEASAAYELSLKLDPDNIVSTYNLERLQDSKESSGGEGDKDPKPTKPNTPKPKNRI